MAKFAGLRDPVTLDFEGSTMAYCVDAVSISLGQQTYFTCGESLNSNCN